jgi:hypothetical protein
LVREKTKATGVLVVVFNGELGSGLSMQASPEMALRLPDILEAVAAQLRRNDGQHECISLRSKKATPLAIVYSEHH